MKYKRVLVFFLIIFLLGLLSVYYPKLTGKATTNNQEYEKESALVTKIVDGDTIHVNLNGKDETIRLLGINTPEKSTPYYKKSYDYLSQIENKTILVLRDKEDLDKYNRKLRYIFYEDRILNVEILENGLATSFMTEELKYEDKLRNAEEFAKKNNLGLWEKSRDTCANCIELIELNYTEEFFIIKNKCEFDCNLTGFLAKDDANHFFKLNQLNSGEEKEFKSNISVWNDAGDRLFVRDPYGKLVLYYEY
jgi:micrococcal nuclease